MPETSPGGEGRKYSASIRMKVSRVEDLKDKDGLVIGVKSKLETVKNKTFYPHRICEVSISHRDGGFYEAADIYKLLLDKGIFTKVRGWVKFQEKSYHEADLIQLLEENKEFVEKMKKLIGW